MANAQDDGERIQPETADAWGEWLEENHEREAGVWLISWKKHTGKADLSYEDAVTEALRFGWIDSKGSALDDDRSMLWFSPRRKGSAWSRPNKKRIARLEREHRMAPAGARMVESAKADGSWSRLDEVENLKVPGDLAAAFDGQPGSREQWDGFPPSARRAILEWIVQAKREPTRAKRVEETARLAATGRAGESVAALGTER